MKTKFLTDEKGNKLAAIVPITQFRDMIDKLDMIEDQKLLDEALASGQDFLPADQAFKEIEENRAQNGL